MNEYISKQSVIDYLNGYLIPINECGADSLFDRGQRRALTNAIQDIMAIKAADVQPVKHGKWVQDKWQDKCTNCEKRLEDLFEGDFYYDCEELHFCPNCGAKMEGDDK